MKVRTRFFVVVGASVVVGVTVVGAAGCLDPLFIGAACNADADCEGALVCVDDRCLPAEGEGEGEEGEGEEGEGEEGEGEEGEGEEGEGEGEGEGEDVCVSANATVVAGAIDGTIGVAASNFTGDFFVVAVDNNTDDRLTFRMWHRDDGTLDDPFTLTTASGVQLALLDVSHDDENGGYAAVFKEFGGLNRTRIQKFAENGAVSGNPQSLEIDDPDDVTEIRVFIRPEASERFVALVSYADSGIGTHIEVIRMNEFTVIDAGSRRDIVTGAGLEGPFVERDGVVHFTVDGSSTVNDLIKVVHYDLDADVVDDGDAEIDVGAGVIGSAFLPDDEGGGTLVFQTQPSAVLQSCRADDCAATTSSRPVGNDNALATAWVSVGGNRFVGVGSDRFEAGTSWQTVMNASTAVDTSTDAGPSVTTSVYNADVVANAGAIAVVERGPDDAHNNDLKITVACDPLVTP